MEGQGMKNILIVGDSHTGALERGRAHLAETGALPEGVAFSIVPLGTGARMNRDFWQPEGAQARIIDPAYSAKMPLVPPEGATYDAIGLSMPMWSGRILRGLLTDGQAPLDAGGQGTPGQRPLSAAAFRRIVRADMGAIMGFARFLRAQGHAVFAIEPPRMFRHYRLLNTVSPGHALALQGAIRAQCRADVCDAGLALVDLPDWALDEAGFMRGAYANEDPTDRNHANAAFGARLLHDIAAALPAILTQQAAAPNQEARA
jgi:hypothetical protein